MISVLLQDYNIPTQESREITLMKILLKRVLPRSVKTLIKRIYHLPRDFVDGLKGRNDMIPPRGLINIGDGDFKQVGEGFTRQLVELGNLQPGDRVLDVGCGLGRMAIPLSSYLSNEGEYWGFDFVKKGVEWCQNHISQRNDNFHFIHSNIYNKQYNPKGDIQARNYTFPFDNQFFDFVFLASVFTHMLPPDVETYVRQISRVLKKDGKCMITFFLLNDESVSLIHSGNSKLDFRYEIDGCLTTDRNTPEDAIAYDEEFIKNLFHKQGLIIRQPVYYGSWCNRQNFYGFQDLIIAEKNIVLSI